MLISMKRHMNNVNIHSSNFLMEEIVYVLPVSKDIDLEENQLSGIYITDCSLFQPIILFMLSEYVRRKLKIILINASL